MGKKFLGIGFCQKGGEKWVGRGWGKNSWVLVFAKRAEKNGSVGGGEKIIGYCFFIKTTNLKIKNKKFWKIKKKILWKKKNFIKKKIL